MHSQRNFFPLSSRTGMSRAKPSVGAAIIPVTPFILLLVPLQYSRMSDIKLHDLLYSTHTLSWVSSIYINVSWHMPVKNMTPEYESLRTYSHYVTLPIDIKTLPVDTRSCRKVWIMRTKIFPTGFVKYCKRSLSHRITFHGQASKQMDYEHDTYDFAKIYTAL